jgi:hypothetical protein
MVLAIGPLRRPAERHSLRRRGDRLARWAAGETDSPGLWTFTIDESARGSLTIAAPVIGLVVTLASAAALGSWRPRNARPDDH